METIDALLSQLQALDIKLWIDNERLRYDAPRGALTSELRDRLVARKAEVIALLKQRQVTTRSTDQPLQTISRSEPLPLSFAQERIWFLEYVGRKQGAYNMPLAQQLRGELDVAVLERAIAEVVQRHEALRTTFQREGTSAVQVIHPAVKTGEPSLIELENLAVPAAEVEAQLTQAIQRPFDLEAGPLLRLLLVRLKPQEHILLVVTHHIISDAWSEGILMRELSLLYAAFQAKKPSPLPELTIQYADFAHWQRQRLQGEFLETHLAYWRSQLQGATPLKLPSDHSAASDRGDHQTVTMPTSLAQQLKSLARQEKSSLFILLFAAFKALLHRYSGQEDLLVCFPIAGRNHTATEQLIGYFNNILPVRTQLSQDLSLKALVERVHRGVLEASSHQEVPFQKIGALPHLARTPLTRGMFALQNTPQRLLSISELAASYLELSSGKADFDVYLIMEEKGEHLVGTALYNRDRFEAATITNLLKHYQATLEHFVTDLNQPLSGLPTPGGKPWDALVPIKPKGQKRPLFLVHDGLGRTMLYLNLARHLHPERPVYALRPYGSEQTPVVHRRVGEMAAHYVSRLRSVQPKGPYLLGGLSFGGTIAMEMAQQLQSDGDEVEFLALIDSLHIEELRRIGARTFMQELIQQNQAIYEVLPELIREYSAQVYRGNVILFRGCEGEGVDQPNVERTTDPSFGWGAWVKGIEVYDVPGGHYSLLQKPHVETLAAKIEACLKTCS
ncbi:MAG: condensation domain-containing protein [Cyanobacteria bacterium J06639_14]